MPSNNSQVLKTPILNTKTSIANIPSASPSVMLVTSSSTQVPVLVDHARNVTIGEEPLYYVRMKDGTWAYIKESLLSQSGGLVVY